MGRESKGSNDGAVERALSSGTNVPEECGTPVFGLSLFLENEHLSKFHVDLEFKGDRFVSYGPVKKHLST